MALQVSRVLACGSCLAADNLAHGIPLLISKQSHTLLGKALTPQIQRPGSSRALRRARTQLPSRVSSSRCFSKWFEAVELDGSFLTSFLETPPAQLSCRVVIWCTPCRSGRMVQRAVSAPAAGTVGTCTVEQSQRINQGDTDKVRCALDYAKIHARRKQSRQAMFLMYFQQDCIGKFARNSCCLRNSQSQLNLHVPKLLTCAKHLHASWNRLRPMKTLPANRKYSRMSLA